MFLLVFHIILNINYGSGWLGYFSEVGFGTKKKKKKKKREKMLGCVVAGFVLLFFYIYLQGLCD